MKVLIVFAAFLAVAFAGITFPNITQNYGYINANSQYGVNLFYWEFDSLDKPATDPLVVWLTGGPGCSSEMALFFENGPYTVNDDLTLTFNPYAWNSHANLLYVDQPGGTGYSYVTDPNGYVQNEDQVADDFYTFLVGFFKKYPRFVKSDFYITGESYAGHYIPAIAAKIVDMNKKSSFKINLKAVAIGNGLVDPLVQDKSYPPFMYANGLIDQDTVQQMNQAYVQCQQDIEAGDYSDAFNDCNQILGIGLQAAGNINVYDIRKQCDGPLCYDFSNIENYLAQPSVINKLGVSGVEWTTCNQNVYQYLVNDFEFSYRFDIPKLLANDVRVLIYNGNYDLVCNFYGSAEMINTMQWSGQQAFNSAQNVTWNYNGNAVGNSRTANGLTFVVVYNAGHMVPHDQPAAALDLLTRFIKNKPYN
jgi:serine carboxypeptidase-like clade 4